MSDPVIRASDLDQIAWEAMREFQIQTIAAMGDSQSIENRVSAGSCVVQGSFGKPQVMSASDWELHSEWIFPNAKKIPSDADVDPNAVAEIEAAFEPKYFGLIPVRAVRETVIEAISKAAEKTIATLMEKALEHIREKKGGSFIYAAIASRVPSIAQRVTNAAVAKVVKRAVSGSKRRQGIQRIQTRKRLKGYGWFMFSGKWAYRAPRGRPALPENVWLARYKARLKARNKSGRHGKSTGVKVPSVKPPGRPQHIVNLASHKNKTVASFGDTKPSIVDVTKAVGDYSLEEALHSEWESKRALFGK